MEAIEFTSEALEALLQVKFDFDHFNVLQITLYLPHLIKTNFLLL